MEERIYTSELAGHCNEPTAWRLLKEMSDTLVDKGLSPIDPYSIEIHDDGHFTLAPDTENASHEGFDAPETTTGHLTEPGIVWSLAATVFFTVMGRQVMNGKGGKGQRQNSRLPYMRSEWPELSELVQRCLHYDPTQRPSLHDIQEKASKQHQRCLNEIQRGPKIKTIEVTPQNESDREENGLAFWPEQMKKTLLLLILLGSFIGHGFAQTNIDPVLQKLTKTVATLRQPNKKNWDRANKVFHEMDSIWTTMDEILSNENEYMLIGDKQFKLNAILNQCEHRDKKMVRGDFLNGNDPRYKYSLTERGIRGMCSVSYEMRYRKGRQTFVVMPYLPALEKIEVEAYLNGKPVGETTFNEGNIVLNINKNVNESDTIRLVIHNHDNEGMPVVIINHNTKQR